MGSTLGLGGVRLETEVAIKHIRRGSTPSTGPGFPWVGYGDTLALAVDKRAPRSIATAFFNENEATSSMIRFLLINPLLVGGGCGGGRIHNFS